MKYIAPKDNENAIENFLIATILELKIFWS